MQWNNPVGTDGFDFLEYTTNDTQKLINQFTAMGFTPIAKHQHHDVTIYQQNNIRFIINTAKNSMASKFANLHNASACAMGFRVANAKQAFEYAVQRGAKPCQNSVDEKIYDSPAIYGIGDSLIYFVDYANDKPNYAKHFPTLPQTNHHGAGLTYIDHVTHNVQCGNMAAWADFYTNLFNFREIRYFDIEGKVTGLKSKAMTSPCGKIRIPLNESSDDKSQIEEFLKEFNGEGIPNLKRQKHEVS